jgi:hypothetical protein
VDVDALVDAVVDVVAEVVDAPVEVVVDVVAEVVVDAPVDVVAGEELISAAMAALPAPGSVIQAFSPRMFP